MRLPPAKCGQIQRTPSWVDSAWCQWVWSQLPHLTRDIHANDSERSTKDTALQCQNNRIQPHQARPAAQWQHADNLKYLLFNVYIPSDVSTRHQLSTTVSQQKQTNICSNYSKMQITYILLFTDSVTDQFSYAQHIKYVVLKWLLIRCTKQYNFFTETLTIYMNKKHCTSIGI